MDMHNSVVSIQGKNGPVGSGFLVGKREIVTCTHVIFDALGLAAGVAPQEHAEVNVRFPVCDWETTRRSVLGLWQPPSEPAASGPRLADIAQLTLDDGPPEHCVPLELGKRKETAQRDYETYGFPTGVPQGAHASGVIGKTVGKGWRQLGSLVVPGYSPRGGFSGAPVWDQGDEAVAGMVVAADEPLELKVAYMIPAALLREAFPDANLREAQGVSPEKEARSLDAPRPRPQFATSLEHVNEFSSRAWRAVDAMHAIPHERSHLDVQAWVKTIEGAKKVYIDLHVFDDRGLRLDAQTLQLGWKKMAGGGGEFWAGSFELFPPAGPGKPSGGTPCIAQYRLYYEVSDSVYSDGALHQYLFVPGPL